MVIWVYLTSLYITEHYDSSTLTRWNISEPRFMLYQWVFNFILCLLAIWLLSKFTCNNYTYTFFPIGSASCIPVWLERTWILPAFRYFRSLMKNSLVKQVFWIVGHLIFTFLCSKVFSFFSWCVIFYLSMFVVSTFSFGSVCPCFL